MAAAGPDDEGEGADAASRGDSRAGAADDGAPSDAALRERARRLRRDARMHDHGPDDGFDEPVDYLREGFGPAVSLYVESRTGGRFVEFTPEEYRGIEEAMNHWLACYAAARDGGHREEYAPDYAVREAAKLLIETHSARHAADVLMGYR